MARRDSSYDRHGDRFASDRYERRRRSSPRASPATFHDGLTHDGRRRRKMSGFTILLTFVVFGLSVISTMMGVSHEKYSHKE